MACVLKWPVRKVSESPTTKANTCSPIAGNASAQTRFCNGAWEFSPFPVFRLAFGFAMTSPLPLHARAEMRERMKQDAAPKERASLRAWENHLLNMPRL